MISPNFFTPWSTWRLIRYRPLAFVGFAIPMTFYLASRLIPGLIVQSVFDTLTGEAPAALGVWGLMGLLLTVEGTRMVASFTSLWYDITFRYSLEGLLRRNLLVGILRRPGADALTVPPGDALARLRDDVGEVSDFPTWLPHVVGQFIFAAVALVIMARIHLMITLVAVLPLVAVALLTRLSWSHMLRHAHQSRAATSHVTAFLGELFGSVQAIRIARAEESVVAQLERLSDGRRRASLGYRLVRGLIEAAGNHATDFAVGLMLLLVGQAMRSGEFTIGDFTLFATYLFFITSFPTVLGGFLGDYQQQAVAMTRMQDLLPDAPPEDLVAHHPLHEEKVGDAPHTKQPADRLEWLAVNGLRYRYPSTGRGIEGIDLHLPRGSFTVVTGRVGSGKSTLLRALLGLLPREGGEIRWNGRLVDDPANFFVPPRSAYTSQVPRLFSESLRDSILMGLPDNHLPAALHAAVLERDVATLEQGIETMVGPRGVRLSGGQVQRTAAARMFAREAELLVFDDLSSALDVETEQALWERLFDLRQRSPDAPTCLVVSHRPAALRRADHILVLDEGRVVAEGTWEEVRGVVGSP